MEKEEWEAEALETEDVQETLLALVDQGELFGKCPGCDLPLTVSEIKESECESCGDIDVEEIGYFPNESIGSS